MLDLETLSTRPNAVILVICAVRFNRNHTYSEKIDEKSLGTMETFYKRILIHSCLHLGLHVDKQTEDWWNQQDEDIMYEALLNPDRDSLPTVLKSFSKWFGSNPRMRIWGNGSSFDVTILGEAYRLCGIEPPWKYWNVRDLRTVVDLGKVYMNDLPQDGHHNAKYDCYRQIIAFQRAKKNINNNGI